METNDLRELHKTSGAILRQLGLLEQAPEESDDDYKGKMVALNVAVLFPNLTELERSTIIGAFWSALRLTAGVNMLTLPICEQDRSEWENRVREDGHDNLPYFQRAQEKLNVRAKLTPLQTRLLDDMTRVIFDVEEWRK